MTLLLYAIAEDGAEHVAGEGLGKRPLRAVREDDLVAIVSEHMPSTGERSEHQLLQYEQVIESLMGRYTILPAQFGSSFADEADLRAMVRTRRDELATAVSRVRGAVEISVSAAWPAGSDADEPKPSTGTAYMLERVDRHRRASAVAAELRALDEIARASSYRLLVKRSLPVVAAYLVDRDRVDEFAAAVRSVDRHLGDAELICTGPWPPYSFSEGATT